MNAACPVIEAQSGVIRGVLYAVDCQTRRFAQSGYDTLTDPASPFQGWLTAFLVIFVAILGYRMLLGAGRARVSDLPVAGLKIGLVLALTANWSVFQTLVFNLASRAPIEIARLTTAPLHAHGLSLAANPVGAVQFAYDELTASAAVLGKAAGPQAGAASGGDAGAAEALWRASQALFLSSAGLFSGAIVAVGVLTAVGPVFIALALVRATRGLFVGWLRALFVAALAPMAGWIATSLMLVVIAPNLQSLADQRASGRIEVDTAMTTAAVVFVFAIVQVLLLAAGALIGMGWRLPNLDRNRGRSSAPTASEGQTAAPPTSRADALAHSLRRPEVSGLGRPIGASTTFDSAPPTDGKSDLARSWSTRGILESSRAWDPSTPPHRRPAIRSRSIFQNGGGG
ncbi:MAG TPA: type IV secretion system protein [Caulobacteraceae bacterium]